MKRKIVLKTFIIIISLIINTPLFAQNTISVKKKSKIEGFYSHKNKLNNYDYFYFNTNGTVSYAFKKNKSKKHYLLLKECTINKDKCYGMILYNYKINEDFADKGISPFIHIEFYKISKDTDDFDYYSTLQGELKKEVLFVNSRGDRWKEYQFIKK